MIQVPFVVNIEEITKENNTFYAPPKHPKETVHLTKADAEHD